MSSLHFEFHPVKAAQAAAYLLARNDGQMSKGHLIKMLFTADREQLATVGLPITGATPVSMKYGPVLSEPLEMVNKGAKNKTWAKHISVADPDSHMVRLLMPAGTDHLTPREIASLDKAFSKLNGMSFGQLSDYCHREFAEWRDPGESSLTITFEAMIMAAGRDQDFIGAIVEQQATDEAIRTSVA